MCIKQCREALEKIQQEDPSAENHDKEKLLAGNYHEQLKQLAKKKNLEYEEIFLSGLVSLLGFKHQVFSFIRKRKFH